MNLFRARTWEETLYLLLDLPVGVAGFTLAVTGLAGAAGLLITFLGLPLLTATLLLARLAGRGELARPARCSASSFQHRARLLVGMD